jgi:hypothetical protein
MLPNASDTRKETDEEKEGLFSRFSKSESAAATAIIAILLLGLAFTIISVVRLEYIPEWKNDAEQDHTYYIWNNMVGVKVRIDMLSQLMESGKYSTDSFSTTVPFSTGGGEVPVFDPSKLDGKLEINTERCIMTIKPYTNQTVNLYYPPLECDGISCYPGNRQYPDQIFRYENGALILADGKSSIMKQSPVLSIENKTGNYNVTIRAVQLLGKPDSISSNAIIPLRLTGLQAMPIYDSSSNNSTSVNAFDLTIATKYPDAWFTYFNEIAQDKGLDYGTDYTIKLDPNSVRFSFRPSGNKTLESLYVSEATISAELIPLRYQNVMKLKELYYFNVASDPTIDLSRLRDYDSRVDFSIEDTKGKDLGNIYSPSNIFSPDNNTLESTFGFNGFTEFESQPSFVTIVMIYQPGSNNPQYQDMSSVSGISLQTLNGTSKQNWYLYKQTVPCTLISDPSKLTYYIKIDGLTSNKNINIDYLAIYLS